MIIEVLGLSLGDQKWVQNGIRIASSTRKPSESLSKPSWSAHAGLRVPQKVILGGSWPIHTAAAPRIQPPSALHQGGWPPYGA